MAEQEEKQCTICGDQCYQTDDNGMCAECANSESYCGSCLGTGISATGRVEDNCSACRGTGEATRTADCDDYDPPDDDSDSYEAEVAMWQGQEY